MTELSSIARMDPGAGFASPEPELLRCARGLIRTAHKDIGEREVVRQWWDALCAAVEAADA